MDTDTAAKHREAEKAIRNFTRDVTVLLIAGNDRRDSSAGSGTLISGASGQPYILTAAHVLKEAGDWKPVRLMAGCTRTQYGNAVVGVTYGPRVGNRDVDVALLTLRDDVAKDLASNPITLASLAPNSMADVSAYSVLAGFPVDIMKRKAKPENKDVLVLDVGLLHLETSSVRVDEEKQLLRVVWPQAPEGAVVYSNDFERSRPVPRPSMNPRGMSGGAFWKYPKAGGGIWSPRSHGKLIGVQVSWNKVDTAFVEPVENFADWLRSELSTR